MAAMELWLDRDARTHFRGQPRKRAIWRAFVKLEAENGDFGVAGGEGGIDSCGDCGRYRLVTSTNISVLAFMNKWMNYPVFEHQESQTCYLGDSTRNCLYCLRTVPQTRQIYETVSNMSAARSSFATVIKASKPTASSFMNIGVHLEGEPSGCMTASRKTGGKLSN
ncbi:hypothetical protein CPC08DRAFT_730576 [Agrocybe pediades]|nr:hypothetical protein CPC08DRAFT_730576 [Agrocybe pediades]